MGTEQARSQVATIADPHLVAQVGAQENSYIIETDSEGLKWPLIETFQADDVVVSRRSRAVTEPPDGARTHVRVRRLVAGLCGGGRVRAHTFAMEACRSDH